MLPVMEIERKANWRFKHGLIWMEFHSEEDIFVHQCKVWSNIDHGQKWYFQLYWWAWYSWEQCEEFVKIVSSIWPCNFYFFLLWFSIWRTGCHYVQAQGYSHCSSSYSRLRIGSCSSQEQSYNLPSKVSDKIQGSCRLFWEYQWSDENSLSQGKDNGWYI